MLRRDVAAGGCGDVGPDEREGGRRTVSLILGCIVHMRCVR